MASTVAGEAQGFDSYITGLREHASLAALLHLRPGAELQLRPARVGSAHRLEVCTPQGEPLGWLPVEDSLALGRPAQFGGDPAVVCSIGMLCGFCGTLMTPLAANFNLVPARLLPRVHIRIFITGENLVA